MQRARRRWELTAREAEVLAHLVVGLSTKVIAERLRCAEATVEVHVSNMLRKAGATSRTALVAKFWMAFAVRP